MKKGRTGVVYAILLLSASQAFSNKNPCSVDCVKKLIADNTTVSAAAGIGSATSSIIQAYAANPSLKIPLECSYRATLQVIIQSIKTSTDPVNDCANGAGIANGGLIEGFARNPSLSQDLNCYDYWGLNAIDSICHTNYSSGNYWVPNPGSFDPTTCTPVTC